jgi:RES domain-containing protein
VKLKAHPRYNVFEEWFSAHAGRATRVDGRYYRVAGPRHTTAKEIVQGVGAYVAGGRWNPPEVMNVVYLSVEPETAVREANEHRRHFHLPLWEGMPKVIVAVEVAVDAVIDLTDGAVAADLPEPLTNLLAEDWRAVMARGDEATTQALGRAAFDAKLQGLIVPSKPDSGGVNLLVFPPPAHGRLSARGPEPRRPG